MTQVQKLSDLPANFTKYTTVLYVTLMSEKSCITNHSQKISFMESKYLLCKGMYTALFKTGE